MEELMASLLSTENFLFVRIPDVQGEQWDDEILRKFRESFPEVKEDKPWINYVYFRL